MRPLSLAWWGEAAIAFHGDMRDDVLPAEALHDLVVVLKRKHWPRCVAQNLRVLQERNSGKTYQEVGDACGLSRERARQIEAVILHQWRP